MRYRRAPIIFGVGLSPSSHGSAHLSAGRARRGAGAYHSRPPSGLPGSSVRQGREVPGTESHPPPTAVHKGGVLFSVPTHRLSPGMALRPKDWPPPGALFATAAALLDPLATEEEHAAGPAALPNPTPPTCSERFGAATVTSHLLAAHMLGHEDASPQTTRPWQPGPEQRRLSTASSPPSAQSDGGKRWKQAKESGGGATPRKAKRRRSEST